MSKAAELYNGWTNYETWRINLEMLDGMGIEDFGYDPGEVDPDSPESVHKLSEALEMYVWEIVEQGAKGFALDLANSFLARVDWNEIAEHMLGDARAEAAAENTASAVTSPDADTAPTIAAVDNITYGVGGEVLEMLQKVNLQGADRARSYLSRKVYE